MLVGIALFVLQMNSFEKAVSQEIRVNTLKQITFHKMNYDFEQFYCLDQIVERITMELQSKES